MRNLQPRESLWANLHLSELEPSLTLFIKEMVSFILVIRIVKKKEKKRKENEKDEIPLESNRMHNELFICFVKRENPT